VEPLFLAAPLAEFREAVARAADWGVTGIMGTPGTLGALAGDCPDSLGLMAIGQGRPQDCELEIDFQAVEPGQSGGPEGQEDASFTLDLRGSERPMALSAIESALNGAAPLPAAVLLGAESEDALEALAGFDDVAVFVPGDAFASGYRLGAGSHFGVLTSLHPRSAVRAAELAAEDVTGALDVELRLQRFLEAKVEPLVHRLRIGRADREGLLLEILGWIAVSEPRIDPAVAQRLEVSLRQDVPELFADVP